MGNKIMQETTPLVECSAFHRGMSVLEASLRNTEDSETIISGLLKGAAEFYGASRASVVEADWDLGIGVITYEWCKDGVPAQRDMLQCLPMEKFPRWRKALRANKPVVISDLQRLENVYPDEAAFFREYGVTTLLAAPFSKRINQGFIAVDDPTRYTDDPVFLFIASYAVVVELNEIKQQQSLLAATKASKYNPEDIHINFFGGMEIISSKGTLTGEDIKADQCYLLLAYLILNHKKNFSVDTLAEIICPYDELDSPYKIVNNIVYRLRRTLSVIGLDKLVIGKNGTFQINPNFNISEFKNSIQGGLPAMKKKLFCIFGLILIVSAIAYFCHDRSVLPLDAENANYISFKIYPQNEPNYMVTNDDRMKEIVRAINELDVQETTDQVDRMPDSFYYFWIQISGKDIPVELDEDTISINNERYQADTSDLRELLDKTYRDVMSGVID